MRKEVQTIEFECDECHKKIIVVQQGAAYNLPDGWTGRTTGNRRYEDICPTCSKKLNLNA